MSLLQNLRKATSPGAAAVEEAAAAPNKVREPTPVERYGRLSFTPSVSTVLDDMASGLEGVRKAAGKALATASVAHSKGRLRTNVAVKDLLAPRFDQAAISTSFRHSPSLDLDCALDLAKGKYTLGATWRGQLNEWPAVARARWSEADGQLLGELQLSVDPQNKLLLRASPHQLREARWAYAPKGRRLNVEPGFDFVTRSASLSLAYKAQGQQLTGRYDAGKRQAVLGWAPPGRPRCKLAVTVPDVGMGLLGRGRRLVPGRPSLSLVLEQPVDLV